MRRTVSGSAHVLIIGVVAVALIAVLGYVFWSNVVNKKVVAEAASYAECVKATGSKIQTTYPEVCVTAGGKSFTNPDQKVAASDKPAAKSFCAPLEKLCFDYPDDWVVTAQKVDAETDGVMERFVISDASGRAWLKLDTGMTGVGGACGNDDNSRVKILKTHSTAIDTAYAAGWAAYNGTAKNWTINMQLTTAEAAQKIGELDPCDVGLGILNGKNAKADGIPSPGALAFRYAMSVGDAPTYTSEAAASEALSSADAVKAYDILQSAHYK